MAERSFPDLGPGRQEGYTLIEVMVAMVIFAVGILAAASMQTTAVGGNSVAYDITNTVTMATNQLEYLTSLPWDHDDLKDTSADGAAGLGDNTAATADHNRVEGDFTIYWNIAESRPMANMKTVNVIVVTPRRVISLSSEVQRTI